MNNNTLPLLLLLLLSGSDGNGTCDNRSMLAMCLSLLLLYDADDCNDFQ